MEINKNVYSEAVKMALKVGFLAICKELFLYAGALYSAMMWGKEINEKIVAIHKKTSLSLK